VARYQYVDVRIADFGHITCNGVHDHSEILCDNGERRAKHAIEVRSECVLGGILLVTFR
jgi:hypothetical protein